MTHSRIGVPEFRTTSDGPQIPFTASSDPRRADRSTVGVPRSFRVPGLEAAQPADGRRPRPSCPLSP